MSLEGSKTFGTTALTGVRIGEGPHNHYREPHPEILNLSARMGKKVEQVAFRIWTGEEVPITWVKTIENTSQLVRDDLSPLTKQTYNKNVDVLPHYQKLTLAPTIPGFGDDITEPTNPHLRLLFKAIDHTFQIGLIEEFNKLTETHPGGGVDSKIKHITETALIISRLTTEGIPPFLDKGLIIPNVWYGNELQFDGLLISKYSHMNSNKKILETLDGSKIIPIELKVSFKNRAITGIRNSFTEKPEKRFIREIQIKLAKLLLAKDRDYQLPSFVYLIFLRGLREHVIHPIRIDKTFVGEWLEGVLYNLRNIPYAEEDTDNMLKLSLILEDNYEVLENRESSIFTPIIKGQKLKKQVFPDWEDTIMKRESKTKTKVVPGWRWKPIKDLVNKSDELKTTINFEGESFYLLAGFLDQLSTDCDYDDKENEYFKEGSDFYGWLTDLYHGQNSQWGQITTPTKFFVSINPTAYSELDLFDSTKVKIKASKFLLEFAGQLLIHLRNIYPQQYSQEIDDEHFKLLRIMAKKFRGRDITLNLSRFNTDNLVEIRSLELKDFK